MRASARPVCAAFPEPSACGGAVGGFQAILMASPAAGATGAQAVHGNYRAGSDHRKDGQAE
jgi:hypothetical protein